MVYPRRYSPQAELPSTYCSEKKEKTRSAYRKGQCINDYQGGNAEAEEEMFMKGSQGEYG
jgi:hypothetical protein